MIIQKLRRRREGGFTLIELLIVVAIIGIIAAILIPNLIDALQKAKQKRTVADMRTVGSAWFSWYTDQVSSAAAGITYTWGQGDSSGYTNAALVTLLQPSTTMVYIQQVPALDAWRGTYDYTITDDWDNPNLLQGRVGNVMAIRSKGRDQTAETSWTLGPFLATDYDQDIVWADGYLVHYPGGISGGTAP